jgi:hypothetical protein
MGGSPQMPDTISGSASTQPGQSAGRSWMSSGAAKYPYLLYVADYAQMLVNVYAYRSGAGELVGQLSPPYAPRGLCVDGSGNVYVPGWPGGSNYQGKIEEYAHGSTVAKHHATLLGIPDSCAVDRSTGNIAVTLLQAPPSGVGGLDLITGGLKGKQTFLNDPGGMTEMVYDAYDPAENLFVDGDNGSEFLFEELPQGSSHFVHLTGFQPQGLGPGVQWDGKYIAEGENLAGKDRRGILAVNELTVSGSVAKVVRVRTYNDRACKKGLSIEQMAIAPNIPGPQPLIGVNFNCPNRADFWQYIHDGAPERSWDGLSLIDPDGLVLSAAQP